VQSGSEPFGLYGITATIHKNHIFSEAALLTPSSLRNKYISSDSLLNITILENHILITKNEPCISIYLIVLYNNVHLNKPKNNNTNNSFLNTRLNENILCTLLVWINLYILTKIYYILILVV